MAITPYSGTVPDRISAGNNTEYATSVYNWLIYLDGTWVTTVNSTEENINAKEASVAEKEALAAAAAETATTKATLAADYAGKMALEIETGTYSSKEHAIGDLTTSGGSAKAWATKTTTTVDGSLYSSKEYASGDATASGGSAKAWATDLASPDGTTSKSAKTLAHEAATSALTANNFAVLAAATYDAFDDRELGSKSIAPIVDNDDNPLQEGAQYWNTTSKKKFLWDGSNWVDQTVTPTDHNSLTNIGTRTHAQLESDIAGKLSGAVSSANAVHTIINDNSWIFNEDGTVTGALQIEITGLYSQTLSGMMKIMITQNDAVDRVHPDYDMLIGGAWRASDHTWHNTKASMDTIAATGLNVRFAHNGSQVFMLIGDTSTVWSYPRLVIREIVSNSIVGGYAPDFTITRATTYPATVDSTLAVSSALLKTGGIMTGAITAIRETKVAIGANDINLANGNLFTKTISTTTTLTVSSVLSSGNANSFILELTNGGSAVVTWWSGVKWAGGTAPVLTTSGVDILGFYSHDGGATWRGVIMAKDSK